MPSKNSLVRRGLRSRALLAVTLAWIAGGCASTEPGRAATQAADAAPRAAPTREAASDLQYTEVSEIRFGKDLVGYLVAVLPVPEGMTDGRPWQPGTALIQDGKMQFIGFISPHGTTYKFDEYGAAKGVGFGSRDAGIAAFFRRNGQPQLVPLGQ